MYVCRNEYMCIYYVIWICVYISIDTSIDIKIYANDEAVKEVHVVKRSRPMLPVYIVCVYRYVYMYIYYVIWLCVYINIESSIYIHIYAYDAAVKEVTVVKLACLGLSLIQLSEPP